MSIVVECNQKMAAVQFSFFLPSRQEIGFIYSFISSTVLLERKNAMYAISYWKGGD